MNGLSHLHACDRHTLTDVRFVSCVDVLHTNFDSFAERRDDLMRRVAYMIRYGMSSRRLHILHAPDRESSLSVESLTRYVDALCDKEVLLAQKNRSGMSHEELRRKIAQRIDCAREELVVVAPDAERGICKVLMPSYFRPDEAVPPIIPGKTLWCHHEGILVE